MMLKSSIKKVHSPESYKSKQYAPNKIISICLQEIYRQINKHITIMKNFNNLLYCQRSNKQKIANCNN